VSESKHTPVAWLVATGATHEGRETYTRHEQRPPLCDAEPIYAPDLAAEVERLRVEHEGPDSWGANAKHLLARCPYTVRQRPGGGPEDIKSSLVVTFMGMQQDLAAERRKVEALREALRFYAQREHFALSDANAWDTVSGEPQNYWCDDAGTATVEDGATARAALASTEGGA